MGPDASAIPSAGLRVVVLVKQVPRFEAMELGPDGRLVRDGIELEMNPYCRRAVTAGVALAAGGGRCTVLTLGPPPAEDCLREAIAWGADDGVLVTDPALAGSDTLATARALAAAVRLLGDVDVVVCGRNSVDADTAQVPAELAELLDLPLLAAVRELGLEERRLRVRCETDDGTADREVDLPAVVSCAERLCEPCKVAPEGRAEVAADRIRRLETTALGDGPWGQQGSPTRVGRVRHLAADRQRLRLDGPVHEQVHRAVSLLEERRAFDAGTGWGDTGSVLAPLRSAASPCVAVLADPARPRTTRELLGTAARLAAEQGGEVIALGVGSVPDEAAAWGADAVALISGAEVEEDVAAAVAGWCAERRPWALLLPATMWGREVGSRIAARVGAGLVGDAVDLDVENGRLVGWKPAFGGSLVAAITADSPTQLATVRPGSLPLLVPRRRVRVRTEPGLIVTPRGRAIITARHRDDDPDALARAEAVVAVGGGVPPEAYPRLRPLLEALGAEMAATRRVTDQGWLPRSRQVGITGHSVSPRLYVALGIAGKFNHAVGTRGAGTVLAVNSNPQALIFEAADIGITASWEEVVPLLAAAVASRGATTRRAV
ncbi:MAG TPA: FAD-binding protein [Candidatus Dormibacteraeota bacterium]|nr:FAD-binding protein [Candidatus Dormibacteraeota bacterium]